MMKHDDPGTSQRPFSLPQISVHFSGSASWSLPLSSFFPRFVPQSTKQHFSPALIHTQHTHINTHTCTHSLSIFFDISGELSISTLFDDKIFTLLDILDILTRLEIFSSYLLSHLSNSSFHFSFPPNYFLFFTLLPVCAPFSFLLFTHSNLFP